MTEAEWEWGWEKKGKLVSESEKTEKKLINMEIESDSIEDIETLKEKYVKLLKYSGKAWKACNFLKQGKTQFHQMFFNLLFTERHQKAS